MKASLAILLFSVFFFPTNAVSQIKIENNNEKVDSIRVCFLIAEGKKQISASGKNAPSYFIQALRIASEKTTKYFNSQATQALVSLGGYYAFKGMHDSSSIMYQQLYNLGLAHKDEYAIARANLGFGIIADYQADYEKAIRKNMLALKYFESVHDTVGIAPTVGNIANSYIRLKQYSRAIPLLNTAIEMYTQKSMNRQVANNLANLARAYKGLGNKQKELELKLKALAIFKAEGYKKGIATVSINLGVFFEDQHNLEEAKKHYYTALKFSREIKDKGNIAILFNNMSTMYLNLSKLDSAVFYADSAYYYASKSGDLLSQYDALIAKSSILHTLGKHDEADAAFAKYSMLKDSVYNLNMQKQIADMEVKYDTDKKEAHISLLKKENNIKTLLLTNDHLELERNKFLIIGQIQALTINRLKLKNKDEILRNQQLDSEKKAQHIKKLQQQSQLQHLELTNASLMLKQRNLLLILILIAVIGATSISYSIYNQKKIKQDAALQAEIYKQHEIATKSVFEGEQTERLRIARDLHDSIGQMLAVIKLNVSNFQNDAKGDINNVTLTLVDKTIAEVRNISHNLIPEELNFGLYAALEDMCDKITACGKTEAVLNYQAEAQSHIISKQNEVYIYRVVQEILANMIKHACATVIHTTVNIDNQKLELTIQDNGKGFDTQVINHSNGLGWKNIAARIRLMNGEINVRSEQSTGTLVSISIPV